MFSSSVDPNQPGTSRNTNQKHFLCFLGHPIMFTVPFMLDVNPITFGNKQRHWPIVTQTYRDKFDSTHTTAGQISLPGDRLVM